jgi:arginyl-tRNA synthetase
MTIQQQIKELIQHALAKLELRVDEIHLEHPTDFSYGDYSTNVAMVLAKAAGKNPRQLADEILGHLDVGRPSVIAKVDVAGPGFINFSLSVDFFVQSVQAVLEQQGDFGKNDQFAGQKIMVEYTDPNPFKVFHIGHLMSNAIGEATARLHEFAGANVVRACYQGDVGLHVAKALWGVLQNIDNLPLESDDISIKTRYLGDAYVSGSTAYEELPEAKEEIHAINKKVYERSDDQINELYTKGRAWSLEHFEEIYQKLGTKFVHYFFESEVSDRGLEIVNEYLDKGVFEKSEGAIIFPGEKYGLHDRVFINSIGIPTYEGKELGLFEAKDQRQPDLDRSITITAEEQREYMRVVVKALEQINPGLAAKFYHMTHGMLRFAEGKMSSRKGNVVTGESLISDVFEKAKKKLVPEGFDEVDGQKTEMTDAQLKPYRDMAYIKEKAEVIAVGAIKYSVLKQAPGKDIIYDFEKSLSFEGDSGPYLQYTYARTQSILRKATDEGIASNASLPNDWDISDVERIVYRFPEVIDQALTEYAPHYVATYLIELARTFNSFYGSTQILNPDDSTSGYKLALTEAVGTVIKNGLWVLGIDSPEKM